jgi:hypothetical protein
MAEFRDWFGAAVTSTLMLTLVACTSIDVQSNRFLGAPTYSPTSPEAVEILQREPTRPYERLAQIVIEPYGDPPVSEMEQKVKTAAAQLGADAVIIEYDGSRLTGWNYLGPRWSSQAYAQYGRVIVTVAIHYTGG